MKIEFCEIFTAEFTKENFINNSAITKTLEIDLDKAKKHIENCEFCSKNVADLIDNFTNIISPVKMIKLMKSIK